MPKGKGYDNETKKMPKDNNTKNKHYNPISPRRKNTLRDLQKIAKKS